MNSKDALTHQSVDTARDSEATLANSDAGKRSFARPNYTLTRTIEGELLALSFEASGSLHTFAALRIGRTFVSGSYRLAPACRDSGQAQSDMSLQDTRGASCQSNSPQMASGLPVHQQTQLQNFGTHIPESFFGPSLAILR